MFYANEKTALFFDGRNFHATARALDFDVDYKKLHGLFQSKCRLIRASYFTIIPEGDEYQGMRPLLDWMQYNGWTVVAKPVREYITDTGQRKLKGTVDVEMAVQIMKAAAHIDHAVLFTGNRDFRPLVAHLQDMGVRVTIVSSTRTQPQIVSDDLRRQADAFVDLADLRDQITKSPHADQAA